MRAKNTRMLFQSIGAMVFSMALGFVAIQSSIKNKNTGIRMPQSSVNDIYNLLAQIEKDIENPAVFNRDTAVAYIKKLTEGGYNLTTKDLYPDTAEERAQFAETRSDWMDRLFRIQLLLRDKMFEFHKADPLAENQITAFRNGNMYLSYAQDFVLMEWATTQDLTTHKNMFASEYPMTTKNPKFKQAQLRPGDVILVRGDSFISATIARSGDYVTNYSHVAMVVQDPKGNMSVAEALMEQNLKIYSLDQYLSLEKLSRAVILRPKDPKTAIAAALAGYKIIDDDLKAPVKKAFDMLMDPNQNDKIYCYEFVKLAYDTVNIKMPAFPMTFRKALAGNSFYKGMGSNVEIGAAPDDAFFQPEFDVVAVQRDASKLKSDWAFDIAASALFDFINERFEYKRSLTNEVIAKLVLFVKNDLNIKISGVPSGVPAEVIALIMQHKTITIKLQTELMKAMDVDPRPLAYKELEAKAHAWLTQNKDKYFVPCSPKAKSCGGMLGRN